MAHGIEAPAARAPPARTPTGQIVIELHQEGNDVSVDFRDDGAGLNLARIREQALAQGLLAADAAAERRRAGQPDLHAGLLHRRQVTELAGRGIGMDVVRAEVNALGGRIETATRPARAPASSWCCR